VGFLLLGKKGVDGPRLEITDQPEVMAVFQSHVARVGRDDLFTWGLQGAQFTAQFRTYGGHNAFICYNRRDGEDIQRVREELHREGLTSWVDTDMPGGVDWENRIRMAIHKSPCALVFLGTHGLGYYQVREIELLLRRKAEEKDRFQVIPVTIGNGSYESTPLASLNIIPLARSNDIKMLVRSVRSANGF
jgi:hypothetical protein